MERKDFSGCGLRLLVILLPGGEVNTSSAGFPLRDTDAEAEAAKKRNMNGKAAVRLQGFMGFYICNVHGREKRKTTISLSPLSQGRNIMKGRKEESRAYPPKKLSLLPYFLPGFAFTERMLYCTVEGTVRPED